MPSQSVQGHYAAAGTGNAIAARVVNALRATAGREVAITPETLAPFDQFHGGGLPATQALAALIAPKRGDAVVDIGAGIGGPARWIAATYNCTVIAVDLTPEFCEAAQELGRQCGLTDCVRVMAGSALALPLPDASVDRAYSQYVVMNIKDKAGVYREAFRVLKPGGTLMLSHINAGASGPPMLPLPWAQVPEHNYLATDDQTRLDLLGAGFEIAQFLDVTLPPAQQRQMRQKLEAEGMPAAGSHILAGAGYLEQLINALRAGEEGRLRTISVLAYKPKK